MLKLKKFGAISVMLVAALSLTACGGGTSSTSNAQGKTTVSVWHYWDGANADAFDKKVKAFNASHKNIEIKTTNVPNADFLTKLRASATSNTLPDMAIGDLIWMPQMAQIGKSADLKKLLKPEVIDNINPALKNFGSIDGRLVSVPMSANNLAYMYNRTIFKKAGLDPDKPPKTWAELKQMAKQIKDKTGLPGYDLPTEAGDSGEALTWNFQVNLWQAGGEFLKKDNSAAAFNTPAGKKAANFWMDLIKSGVSPYAGWGKFEKGKGGSAQEGSWMVGIWAADPPFDFAAAPLPTPEGGKPSTNLGGEQAMLFNNDDAKVKAAAEFVTWFLQDKQVLDWCESTGFLPATKSADNNAEYRSWVEKKEPRLLPYIEQMATAHTRPNTKLYPQISLAFAKEMEKAFSGEVNVGTALKNAEKAVNEVISQGK